MVDRRDLDSDDLDNRAQIAAAQREVAYCGANGGLTGAATFVIHDTPGAPIVLAIYGPSGRLEADRQVAASAALVMAEQLLGAVIGRLQRGAA